MKSFAQFFGLMAALVMLQPFLNFGGFYLQLIPVVLVYAAVRLSDLGFVSFVILGGLFYDFIVLENFGLTPLIWGTGMFMARSQSRWLHDLEWKAMTVMCFVTSFFIFSLDRLLFLAREGYWDWNMELSLYILQLSLMNAAVPVLFRMGWYFARWLRWRQNRHNVNFVAYATR